MFYLISGGSGSGKSEYAETIAVRFAQEEKREKVYIATMMAFDEEAEKKIARHRCMRKKKQFKTVECFMKSSKLILPNNTIVLLDCLSNLLANEMYAENGAKEEAVQEILNGMENIKEQCVHFVLVTNEIYGDGCIYEQQTQQYVKNLGTLNQMLAKIADVVVEVVCGIPICYKGKELIK